MTTWKCYCGYENPEKLPTDKRTLTCGKCHQRYIVNGTHVDGQPMLHIVGPVRFKIGGKR